jgi:hypothetical protein
MSRHRRCDHRLARTTANPAKQNFFNIIHRNVENAPHAPTTHESARIVRDSKGEKDMKYILMMNCPKTGYDTFGALPMKDIQAHIAFMKDFSRKLGDSGELVAAEGLADPKQAKAVRAGKDGAPITDGVFPEAKEFLAGYWIVDVENPERAYQIAAGASAAPGPGGAPMNMLIEVRQVMSGPPEDLP